MDDSRIGLVIRALRRRRGWRQRELADRSGISQGFVSIIERGHLERSTVRSLRAVLSALDARVVVDIRWRGGEIERLIDADHARLVRVFAAKLRAIGWLVAVEVSYSTYGGRGSIDILALHPAGNHGLVVEIKTEILSAEQVLRKLDEKARLGAGLIESRFQHKAVTVSRMLVVEEASTARRRVEAEPLFRLALATAPSTARRWLRAPVAEVAAILFLSPSTLGSHIQRQGVDTAFGDSHATPGR